MKTTIQIRHRGESTPDEMFGISNLQKGDEWELDHDCKIKFSRYTSLRTIEITQVFELVVAWSTGIGTGVIANWLYDKLKQKDVSLSINYKKVEIDASKIKIEMLEMEKRSK